MAIKISVIVASRMNSSYLARFLQSYAEQTTDKENTELLVMYPSEDTYNQEVIRSFPATFVPEDHHLGRFGLHVYYNELAKLAQGDWVFSLCEDMTFLTPRWDDLLRADVADIDPHQIWMVCPHFKPIDLPMAHMVSRIPGGGGQFCRDVVGG